LASTALRRALLNGRKDELQLAAAVRAVLQVEVKHVSDPGGVRIIN